MQPVPTDEVKNKFRNLRQHMPDQEKEVYEFARLLADRIGRVLLPQGLVLSSDILILDLQRDVNSQTEQPFDIESRLLIGHSDALYQLLGMSLPGIATVAISKEFGDVVEELCASQ